MAETAITVTEIAGPYLAEATVAQLTTVTLTAGDATNNNVIDMGGRDILLIIENNTGAPVNVTINSSNDPYGRTADISAFAVPANSFVARRFSPLGWEENTGDSRLIVEPAAVDLDILAVRL